MFRPWGLVLDFCFGIEGEGFRLSFVGLGCGFV